MPFMKTLLLLLSLFSSLNALAVASAKPEKKQVSRCFYFENGLPENRGQPLDGVDFLLVSKSQKKLVVLHKYQVAKIYDIALGYASAGHKTQEGDYKTPTGFYKISAKNDTSDFHLSLRINYPNKADVANAKKLGVNPGGDIMIHGMPKDSKWYSIVTLVHPKINWTRGCLALTNAEIEELFPKVKTNTPIEICE
jgi:murein L,D-transpeptidase YafK